MQGRVFENVRERGVSREAKMDHCRRRHLVMILLTGLFIVGTFLEMQAVEWPNCDFQCTAKDVVLTRAYAPVIRL